MGIFDTNSNSSFSEELSKDAQEELLEAYIYDELAHLSDEKREEFLCSEAANIMKNKGLIGRRTLVKLSKVDDLDRRIGMAALQISKDKDDPLYHKLAKVRSQERELLNKINKKYETQATRAAKMGQKDYLKHKLPVGFMRK